MVVSLLTYRSCPRRDRQISRAIANFSGEASCHTFNATHRMVFASLFRSSTGNLRAVKNRLAQVGQFNSILNRWNVSRGLAELDRRWNVSRRLAELDRNR